jgi:hypothetical protein
VTLAYGNRRPRRVSTLQLGRNNSFRTSRNPTMACRPPIIPKSMPYWKGLRIMTPHARKRRQWAVQGSRVCVKSAIVCLNSVEVSENTFSVRGRDPYSCEDQCPGCMGAPLPTSAERRAKYRLCCRSGDPTNWSANAWLTWHFVPFGCGDMFKGRMEHEAVTMSICEGGMLDRQRRLHGRRFQSAG